MQSSAFDALADDATAATGSGASAAGANPDGSIAHIRWRWLARVDYSLAYVVTWLAKIGAIVLGAVVLFEVAARYFLNLPLTWSEELARYVLVWVVLLGITMGVRSGTHYGMDFVVRKLNSRLRPVASAISDGATVFFFIVIAWQGFEAVRLNSGDHSAALGLPMMYVYGAFAVSGFVGVVHALTRICLVSTRPTVSIARAILVAAAGLVAVSSPVLAETYVLPVVIVAAVVLAICGTPIAVVIGDAALLAIGLTQLAPLEVSVEQMFGGINNFTLIAVPFFMLTGTVLSATGLADRIIDFALALVGRARGGLGFVDILASVLFADISGSSTSDTAAIGSTMIPGMVKNGYRAEFAVALQAATGSMGMLVPPSISTIVYATVASVSVTEMFIASLLPAALMAGSFALVVYWYARRANLPRSPRLGLAGTMRAFRRAILPLLTPVIILAGIFAGVMTPAEAGAVALAYTVVVGACTRTLSVRGASNAVEVGTRNSSMVFFVISTALLLSWLLTYEQVPQQVATIALGLGNHPVAVLLLIMLLLVILHTALEAVATILIITPILVPALVHMGVSPVHFGVLLMMNSSMGLILPPIGLCLYIASAIGKVPLERAAKAALPFAAVIALDIVLLILLPQISTILPSLFHHGS
jgi:C4-dicarboxylate transporter DctM subunit